MAWLGVRCWKDRIALVVVEDGEPPTVLFNRRHKAPARAEDHGPHVLWFHRMVVEAIEETKPDGVAIRIASVDPDQIRAECEGAVAVAAAQAKLPTMDLRQQRMWNPLGVADAKSTSWKAFLQIDPTISSLVGEEREAACASLAASRR